MKRLSAIALTAIGTVIGTTTATGWGAGTAVGQVVPDGTVPTQVSRPGGDVFVIEGGDRAGANLFHSFREFSVPTGGEAWFNQAQDIGNIFSRVTGGTVSDIDGLIRANGSANLFLINPAGLVFGPNARLDLGGAFYGSTAAAVHFADGVTFAATETEAAPLLTLSVPVGLQFGATPGAIAVTAANLNVRPDTGFALVGGAVTLAGATLTMPDAPVVLGGVAGSSTVTLAPLPNRAALLGLTFPEADAGSPVALTANTAIEVLGSGRGSVVLQGSQLTLTDSRIEAGSVANGVANGASPGTLTLTARGPIALERSQVRNRVGNNAQGNGGAVTVTGDSVMLTAGARLDTSTAGQGNGGPVTVTGRDRVFLAGSDPTTAQTSGIVSTVASEAVGNAGEITVRGRSVVIEDGAALDSSTRGRGNGGLITVTADEAVTLAGTAPNGTDPSGAFSSVLRPTDQNDAARGIRQAGDIRITAGGDVTVRDGARLDSSTFSWGDGGAVWVQAGGTVAVVGTTPTGQPGGILTGAGPFSQGNRGDITVVGERVIVSNGARLSSVNANTLNANTLNANTLNANRLGTPAGNLDPNRSGATGSVTIQATDTVTLAGTAADGTTVSGVFSAVESEAWGDAGDIAVQGRSVTVQDGAALDSSTRGRGNGGLVTVTADESVMFAGTAPNGTAPSGAFSSVLRPTDQNDATRGTRQAGGIRITAGGDVVVRDGARLDSSTYSLGQGGSVAVQAAGAVRLVGVRPDGESGGVFAGIGRNGQGLTGTIALTGSQVDILDGAVLASNVSGQGDGAPIAVTARDRLVIGGSAPDGTTLSRIASRLEATGQGNAGAITLDVGSLEAIHGGAIDSSTRGQGNAGQITIAATDAVRFVGTAAAADSPSGAFTGVLKTATGNASGIAIAADSIEIRDGARLDSSSFGQGSAGVVELRAAGRVLIDGDNGARGVTSGVGANAQGNAGGVLIAADEVVLRNGGVLSSVNAIATRNNYLAGNVTVTGEVIRLEDAAQVLANSTGQQGNAILNAETLIMRRASRVTTNAQGDFPGGNIRIDLDRGDRPSILAAIENSDVSANARISRGGRVQVQASILGTEFRPALTPQSDITASSDLGATFSGEVELITPEIDPTSGLLQLSTTLVDAASLVGQDFCAQQRENSQHENSGFVVTGRGGLPERPGDLWDTVGDLTPLADPLDAIAAPSSSPNLPPESHRPDPTPLVAEATPRLVEAEQWAIAADGQVRLVATPTGALPARRSSAPVCVPPGLDADAPGPTVRPR